MRLSNFIFRGSDKTGYPIYLIEQKLRNKTEYFKIAITQIIRETKHGFYCSFKGIKDAGQGGAITIPKDFDAKPFGVKNITDTGKLWLYRPIKNWYPAPGNPGYDLMC